MLIATSKGKAAFYAVSGEEHLAEARIVFCLSEAFFITSVYTFFFSAEEALRIKSEKVEEDFGLFRANIDITFTLALFQQALNVGAIVFFRNMAVNLINTRPV